MGSRRVTLLLSIIAVLLAAYLLLEVLFVEWRASVGGQGSRESFSPSSPALPRARQRDGDAHGGRGASPPTECAPAPSPPYDCEADEAWWAEWWRVA